MCSGMYSASRRSSSYLMKLSSSPRIRHTVLRSGNTACSSSPFRRSRSGRLSNFAIVGVVNRRLHPTRVSNRYLTAVLQASLTCVLQRVFHLCRRICVVESDTDRTNSSAGKEDRDVLPAIAAHDTNPVSWSNTILQQCSRKQA